LASSFSIGQDWRRCPRARGRALEIHYDRDRHLVEEGALDAQLAAVAHRAGVSGGEDVTRAHVGGQTPFWSPSKKTAEREWSGDDTHAPVLLRVRAVGVAREGGDGLEDGRRSRS
jgi:hypothetical protein